MSAFPNPVDSPFRIRDTVPLPRTKFRDPERTATGATRATVPVAALRTLWFNTGTLCNLACATCYIESSPTNDALVYLSARAVTDILDEAGRERMPLAEVGFTGGEPFMNPAIVAMIDDALRRGLRAIVLTNGMKPMRRHEAALLALRRRYGDRLTLRVSLDHHTKGAHEAERGGRSWEIALDGLRWLAANGVRIAVAGRHLPGESDGAARVGYRALLDGLGIALDVFDPERLVIFPEMDTTADVPEITTECWSILGKSPTSVMCATSRMVVHRRGERAPRVVSCTLLPFDSGFDMGATLAEAVRPVHLNHPHCARFCVLGGASCGG